jgi:flagellar biosynthesis/type III secretory pathway chaperone
MKQKIYEKLMNNLEDLTKCYRQLLDVVRSEKEVLRESKIEQLNLINASKDQLITQIKSLDALRGNYARELAHHVGADTVQPRLLEIAVRMGGLEGEKLRTMHSMLELLLKRLMEINKENADSAQIALNNVNKTLESFKDNLMGPKNYKRHGQAQSGPEKSGHLVSREA